MSSYKPSENDGLKMDGTPDKRMNQEFAGGKVDPHEAGKQGGKASGSTTGGVDVDEENSQPPGGSDEGATDDSGEYKPDE